MNDALNHIVRFEFRIVNPRPLFLFNYFCVKFGLVKVKFIEAVGSKLVKLALHLSRNKSRSLELGKHLLHIPEIVIRGCSASLFIAQSSHYGRCGLHTY